MNVVLVNSCFISRPRDAIQRDQTHPRLGVASIAAWLRQAGSTVGVIDPQVLKLDARAAAEAIVREAPGFVGFSAHTEEILDAAAVASEVKRLRPAIRLVVGGYHVSALPEDTLTEFPCFDFGVIREGELPMQALVEGQPPAGIPGIAWRGPDGRIVVNPPAAGIESLDDLPPPAWDLYDLKAYPRGLPIELVRSCPFACSFCFKATGSHVRYKSVERSLDEIERCMREYGAREFFFASSGTFPLSRPHGLELCRGIIARKLDLRWFSATRLDLLDEELLTAMKQSGCYGLNLGAESGDPGILAACQKGVTVELAEQTIRLIHKVGIPTELNFVLGLPNETPESLKNTLRFVGRVRDYSTLANFGILVPLPGTKVYAMAARNEGGLRLGPRDWSQFGKHSGRAIEYDHLTRRKLKRVQSWMYFSYYFGSPRKILQVLRSKEVRDLTRFNLLDPRRMVTLLWALLAPMLRLPSRAPPRPN